MQSAKEYHYLRVKRLLKQLKDRSNDDHKAQGTVSFTIFNMPELLHQILLFIPSDMWPTLALVSKSFSRVAQPLIWKNVILSSRRSIELIIPYLFKNATMIHTIYFTYSSSSLFTCFSQQLSLLNQINLISLTLHYIEISLKDLVNLQRLLIHNLRRIDIRDCILEFHPLDGLSVFNRLESIAFSQDTDNFPVNQIVFSSWPNLKSLHIVKSCLTPQPSSIYWLQELQQLKDFNISLNLKSFYLDSIISYDWIVNTGHASDLEKFISTQHLTDLRLSCCRLPNSFYEGIASSLGSLHTLHLRNCFQLSDRDCIKIIRACPLIKELDLTGIQVEKIDGSDLCIKNTTLCEQLSDTAKHLSSLSLKINEIKDLHLVTKNCQNLRHLKVYSKISCLSNSLLFERSNWNCHQLEELRIDHLCLSIAFDHQLKSATVAKRIIHDLWTVISNLKSLRILELSGHGPFFKYGGKTGLRLLEGLTQLETLWLLGFGSWEYKELSWIMNTHPLLKELKCLDSEMSIPLQAWFKKIDSVQLICI
jgi:hypothetical protein